MYIYAPVYIEQTRKSIKCHISKVSFILFLIGEKNVLQFILFVYIYNVVNLPAKVELLRGNKGFIDDGSLAECAFVIVPHEIEPFLLLPTL